MHIKTFVWLIAKNRLHTAWFSLPKKERNMLELICLLSAFVPFLFHFRVYTIMFFFLSCKSYSSCGCAFLFQVIPHSPNRRWKISFTFMIFIVYFHIGRMKNQPEWLDWVMLVCECWDALRCVFGSNVENSTNNNNNQKHILF